MANTKTEEKETEFRYADLKAFKDALQKAPKQDWVKKRDLGGGKKSNYIPLYVQQSVAEVMFRECYVIDETYQIVANEVLCVIKLQLLPDFPYAETFFTTGVAAKPIQQNSGAKAWDFPINKKANALEYNAPAAKSAAISNAFTNLGNVFGRNLNRDASNDFSMTPKNK